MAAAALVKINLEPVQIVSPLCATIQHSNYQTCSKVVAEWIEYATMKKHEAEQQELMDDFIEFNYSELVLECIQKSLLSKNDEESICVCTDSGGFMQSVACVDSIPTKTPGFLRVQNIATNPRNIRSKLNNITPPVKGASCNLMHYIEKLATATKCNVILNPLGNSLGFYEKCGYVEHEDGFFIKVIYPLEIADV